jgi:CubicO group peptidase (beta-lactamase class C family)
MFSNLKGGIPMKKQRLSKMRLITFLTAFFLLVFFIPVKGDEISAKVDKLFSKWNKNDSPGCALAVIKDGKIIYKQGYGMADLERDVKLSSKSVFDIGSTSKQFVAMSILLLEEEGKLSLDDDIRQYFPGLPDYGDKITIRHLIHHTSGIRDYLGLMYMAGMNFANDYPEPEIIELIARQKALNFKPGDEHLYSNSGYFLLGEIVKRASGKSLGKFARDNIFKPLGMKNTQFYDDYTRIIKNRAIGYMPKNKGGFHIELYLFDLVGDGGVLTSVEDLFLWDQNFYHNKLGKRGQDLINKMHKTGSLNNGKKLDYAFALTLGNYRGLKTVSHGGGWAGYRAQLIRFPEQKFSIVCLANLGTINPTRMTYKVADIYLADYFKEKPGKNTIGKKTKQRFIKLSRKVLKKRTGAFRNPKTGSFWTLSEKENKLQVKTTSGFIFHLSPLSKTKFHAVDAPVEIKLNFLKKDKSEAQKILVKIQNRDAVVYEYFQIFSPTFKQLQEYMGNYYSEELNVTYKFMVKNNKLIAKIKYIQEDFVLSPGIKDEFIFKGAILTFKRDEQNRVSGYCLNAGRVKNICFVKK